MIIVNRTITMEAMTDPLRIDSLTGDAARAVFPDLARLRIAVFREWPYLYDGDAAYEERYLSTYADSHGGVVVIVRDGDRAVGAATALPLADETEDVIAPFRRAGIPVEAVFYLGESVLLPEYRGRGLGHVFFDRRESQARALGYSTCAFCAVQRPVDHPRRPPGYVPLNGFWQKRGYRERPDLETTFSWQDLGDEAETPKPMRFWIREL